MTHKVRVLIVDDHPMIVEGYKNALLHSKSSDRIQQIDTAFNCDNALLLIEEAATKNQNYEVLFLDISLPASKDGKILSGEDLGIKAKEISPNSRIIILTMLNDNFRLNSILKNVDPDGFLIKTDVTSDELVTAFETVLHRPPYYSSTISSLLRKQITNDFVLDDINRQILHQISIGTKVKDIPNFVDSSIASVERRKRQLKKLFKVEKDDDRALIEKAKERGFV
ncbi:MAG: response regulator [Flavobacteriaceae bacterium]|nr:response regulator [Flavobacteriaceae bacterium]